MVHLKHSVVKWLKKFKQMNINIEIFSYCKSKL